MIEEHLAKNKIDLSSPMQQHVLACVLRVPGLMARLRTVLDPDYFNDETVSDMVAWTVNFWDENKEIPTKHALKDKFRDHLQMIKILYRQEISDPKHTEKRIVEFARASAAARAIMKGGEYLQAEMEGKAYRDPVTMKVEKVDLVELIKGASMVGKNLGDLGEDLHATLDANLRELISPTAVETLGTGIGHLDQAGVQTERGELGCVLAAAKRGKSHVLINVTYNALRQGKNVVYYTLEMRTSRVYKRLYTRIGGKKNDIKQDPVRFMEAVKARIGKYVSGRLMMKQFPARTVNIDDIRAHLEQLIADGFKPDVIVIDYAGLMRPRVEHSEVRHNLESVFVDIRGLVAEYNLWGWTAAQANKGTLSKAVTGAGDFAEAFAIVQHIDIGFSISMSDEDKAAKRGRFFILAARNEQDGCVVEFTFDYARSLYTTENVTVPVEEKRDRDKKTSGDDRDEAAYQKALSEKRKKAKEADYSGERP